MKMKIIVIIVVVLIAIYFFFVWKQKRLYKTRGDFLIEKVEAYKRDKNILPQSVEDLGVNEEMNNGPFYKQISDTIYVIYFNIGFDNSFEFRSDSQEWEWK